MYLAHIRESGEKQTVREHCRSTADLAAKALKPIGLEHSAYLAGLLHDMGKCKEEFAQYLEAAAEGGEAVRGSVNHTFAGVRFLLRQWHGPGKELGYAEVAAELLAFAVGSHHGLFDCIDARQGCGFDHRLTKPGIAYEEALRNYLAECADPEELESLFQASVQEITPLLDKLSALSPLEDDNEANGPAGADCPEGKWASRQGKAGKAVYPLAGGNRGGGSVCLLAGSEPVPGVYRLLRLHKEGRFRILHGFREACPARQPAS